MLARPCAGAGVLGAGQIARVAHGPPPPPTPAVGEEFGKTRGVAGQGIELSLAARRASKIRTIASVSRRQ